jgi:hypothetical protein
MRRSNWTPSIVPRGDDQNVYLVVDDLAWAGLAGSGAKPTKKQPIWKRTSVTCSPGNTRTQPALSRSTLPKAGRKTSQLMLRLSCANDAIYNSATFAFFLQEFVDRYGGRYHDVQLPLPIRFV